MRWFILKRKSLKLMNKEDIISEIIKLEWEITKAVLEGHKASDLDEYREKRIRLKVLRELLNNLI
jgi:hypothetical protein